MALKAQHSRAGDVMFPSEAFILSARSTESLCPRDVPPAVCAVQKKFEL